MHNQLVLHMLRVVAFWFLLLAGPAIAGTNAAPALPPHRSYDEVGGGDLGPPAEQVVMLVAQQGKGLAMHGGPVFDGRDAFLPGKIAVAFADVLLSLP